MKSGNYTSTCKVCLLKRYQKYEKNPTYASLKGVEYRFNHLKLHYDDAVRREQTDKVERISVELKMLVKKYKIYMEKYTANKKKEQDKKICTQCKKETTNFKTHKDGTINSTCLVCSKYNKDKRRETELKAIKCLVVRKIHNNNDEKDIQKYKEIESELQELKPKSNITECKCSRCKKIKKIECFKIMRNGKISKMCLICQEYTKK